MHVKGMQLFGYANHKNTCLEFPERGVVVITGGNGSGKSAIAEALGVALWGKNMRGTSPWGAQGGYVSVTTDKGTVMRERKGERTHLVFEPEGGKAEQYENTTKAQAALTQLVGAYDLWRRASVFTADGLAAFSGADDAERKRFLEAILGLERFDPAAKQVSEDLREARFDVDQLQGQIAGTEQHMQVLQRAIDTHTRTLADLVDVAEPAVNVTPEQVEKLRAKLANLTELREAAQADYNEMVAKHGHLTRADATQNGRVATLRGQTDALLGQAECPTCTQVILPATREFLLERAERNEAQNAEATAKRKKDLASLADQVQELAGELNALVVKVATAAGEYRQAELLLATAGRQQSRTETTRANIQAALERAQKEHQQALDSVALARAQYKAAQLRVVELQQVQKVLGLRGVRAVLLHETLQALELLAQSYLTRLSPHMRIQVRPFEEKADGTMRETIGLLVSEHGEPFKPYAALSSGNRRRADVALLLALSEVAHAARGERPGTLFLDEVFDTLDAPGLAAVAEVLLESARSRCVVVISHEVNLVMGLKGCTHWRVDAGEVTTTRD